MMINVFTDNLKLEKIHTGGNEGGKDRMRKKHVATGLVVTGGWGGVAFDI